MKSTFGIRVLKSGFLTPEWAEVPFVGLSATPWTKGLGKFFDVLIKVATTRELIDEGFLSPFRAFAPAHPDLSGIKTIAGDYDQGQLSNLMRRDGELVELKAPPPPQRRPLASLSDVELFGMCRYYTVNIRQSEKAEGYAANIYRELRGHWPSWAVKGAAVPIEPSIELIAWIKAKNRAYREAQNNESRPSL